MSKPFKKIGRIGVLMGGISTERKISLKSGSAVYESLWSQGLEVTGIDIREPDYEHIKKVICSKNVDLIFITLHGKLGEDGQVQSICEELGVPFTGSGCQASRLAFNKVLTQSLLIENNVVVPEFRVLDMSQVVDIEAVVEQFERFPLVVKPACEGSSIGVSIVQNIGELLSAIDEAKAYGREIMVERYIDGREVTVGILDQTPLDVIEIRPGNQFFDFKSKYQSGQTGYVIPAEIPLEVRHLLQETALKVHTVLGCQHLSRVDFRLDENLKPYVLEINTIPGFTQTSLLPKAAAHVGISFDQLCLTLTELAYGKKKAKKYMAADL